MNRIKIALCIIAATLLWACSRDSAPTPPSLEIARLDRVLADYTSLDSAARADIRRDYAADLTALFQVEGLGDVTDSMLMALSQSSVVTAFSAPVDSAFPNLNAEGEMLGTVLDNARDKGIDIKVKQIAAVTWGSKRSIVVNDTVLFVALNHYLGANHEAYEGWPEYLRATKVADKMPYDITEAMLATSHPYEPVVPSVVSRLLYEGALTYLKSVLVPDATDAAAAGFDEEQYADIMNNRAYVWNCLSRDNGAMLYSTNDATIEGLFALRPYSTPLSPDAPARAARVTGLEIVKSYLKNHPDTPLSRLLTPDFYDNMQTLVEAKYSL